MPIDIYAITNTVNGKTYIGQTKQGYLKRFSQHKRLSTGTSALKRAIAEYGEEAFVCELLDVAYSQEAANGKEIMWIALLKTHLPEEGYNTQKGGYYATISEETKAKMSESKRGEKNSFYGKKHSENTRRKMSEWKKEHYRDANHPGAKAVRCVETGKVYSCVKSAAQDTGANKSHIGGAANGNYGRKTSGGYHWEWVS